MTTENAAAIVSALVATGAFFSGLFVAWMNSRDAALRRADVLAWANEVIGVLESLLLVCILSDSLLDEVSSDEKIKVTIFETAILIEHGRLFFKNVVIDDFGKDKEPAYRGYRPLILDQIIVAHQIACRWRKADTETRLRMRFIAEDCLKKFVSFMQKEVGRERTASADTARGGEGVDLDYLINSVSQSRIYHLRQKIISVPIKHYS